MTTITSSNQLPLMRVNAPFAFAFGAALLVSSAVNPAPRISEWTISTAPLVNPVASANQRTSTKAFPIHDKAVGQGRTAAEEISQLRVLSGLTADQIGRLLGVTRRSIQNWIAGNAMAAQHHERVAQLISLVQALPAQTAGERRAAMLDSSKGPSLFHQLLEKVDDGEKVKVAALTLKERLS